MPGLPPKPANKRQRRNNRHDVGPVLPVAIDAEIPAADPEWLPEVAAEWADYWRSDVSGLVNAGGDLSAVRRLFHYRDEHTRALSVYRAERLSLGPAGQVKVSAMGQMLMKLESLILPLEDRYGLSALARLRLGAELGGATKSLADMNAALAADAEGGEDGDENTIDAEIVDLPGLPKAT